jgi:hypothetical protein
MRATRFSFPSLAAAALCAAALRPAAAQPARANGTDLAVLHADGAPAPAARPRTVAAYRLATLPGAGAAHIALTDSAGTLVARLRLDGDRAPRPMAVEVIDTDLLLQAETPRGVLTLLLQGQNDGDATGALAGRWWLAGAEGTLRGRVTR